MAIVLELPLQEEAWLRKRAARQGKDLDDYVYDLVQRDAVQEKEQEAGDGQNLAEALEGLIGVLDSGKKNGGQHSHVAENTGEEFTNILVEKQKAGHL